MKKQKILLYLYKYIALPIFAWGASIFCFDDVKTARADDKDIKKTFTNISVRDDEYVKDIGQGWLVCSSDVKNCSSWTANRIINVDPYKDIKYQIGGLNLAFPKGRPTLTSEDKRLKITLGMIMHYDAGGFIGPDNKYGEDVSGSRGYLRRGRFMLGVRYDDFLLTVSPDAGEFFHDTYNLYEASLRYLGFKNTSIEIGLFQPRSSMQDAEASNGYEMMERPAIIDIVRNIAGGEPRLSFGGTHYGKRYYIGAHVTGQRLGKAFQQNFQNNQIGGVFRVAVRPVATPDVDVHLGLSSSFAFHGDNKIYSISARQDAQLWLSRQYVRTGKIQGVDNIWAIGPEAAVRWKRLLLQSEFYDVTLERSSDDNNYRPNYHFKGWYVTTAYTLFGQPRLYDPKMAVFTPPTGVLFNPAEGYWGALEVTGRVSHVDLNTHLHNYSSTGNFQGLRGGTQTLWIAGLNWSPSSHMRVMLDFNYTKATASQGNKYNLDGRSSYFITSRLQFTF